MINSTLVVVLGSTLFSSSGPFDLRFAVPTEPQFALFELIARAPGLAPNCVGGARLGARGGAQQLRWCWGGRRGWRPIAFGCVCVGAGGGAQQLRLASPQRVRYPWLGGGFKPGTSPPGLRMLPASLQYPQELRFEKILYFETSNTW